MKPDFDERMRLFKEDPQEFERLRARLVEEVILSAPEERREGLRKLTWRIEAERRRHKSPVGALVALQKMMLEEVYGKGGLLDALEVFLGRKDASCLSLKEKKVADIVPLLGKRT